MAVCSALATLSYMGIGGKQEKIDITRVVMQPRVDGSGKQQR